MKNETQKRPFSMKDRSMYFASVDPVQVNMISSSKSVFIELRTPDAKIELTRFDARALAACLIACADEADTWTVFDESPEGLRRLAQALTERAADLIEDAKSK